MPVGDTLPARGFTYLAVLFLVALIGIVLASTATVWRVAAQRDKEQELLFVGHEFRRAIKAYYEATPGNVKQYPSKLDQLLEDKRQTKLTRHLRRIYVDPFTQSREWGLVTEPNGAIMGVFSQSEAVPVKTGNFDAEDIGFVSAAVISDWKFTFEAKAPEAAKPAAPPAASSAGGVAVGP